MEILLALLPHEEWRDIKDWEGFYQVSNLGRVKSVERIYHCHKRGGKLAPNILKEKFINLQIHTKGYYRVGLFEKRKAKMFYAHRLVAIAFHPNPENRPQVNHKDGNKLNNAEWNLEWSTRIENVHHAFANNLMTIGEDRADSKLTNQQAEEVRNLYATKKYSQRQIGIMFGVAQGVISRITRNIAYTKGRYALTPT